MADDDRGREPPQRVQGAAPPAPASLPVLSEELRQRMQAAVAAKPEDEITEWLGDSARLPPAAKLAPATAAGRPGARLAAQVVIVVIVIGALSAAVVRHFTRPPGTGPASAAVARQEAAARDQAAAWVARQVSRNAVVSCDRVMCAALTAHGFPRRDQLVLGPTSPGPTASAVVVETSAVRDLFGSSLAMAWAPAILASFGSGPAAITVRVVAPHGATAYQTALNTDLTGRKTAGAALLDDPRITAPELAGAQLTGGQVDSRLLLALAALARHQPISIVQFGNSGPGASAGVPLRFVDLAENDQAAHLARAAYVKSVRGYLSTVPARFRPAAMTTVVLAGGLPVLRVEVTAPSPLGMFGGPGSS